jgi:hypothetical protein
VSDGHILKSIDNLHVLFHDCNIKWMSDNYRNYGKIYGSAVTLGHHGLTLLNRYPNLSVQEIETFLTLQK